MAAQTKTPVTGQLDVLQRTLSRAVDRLRDAKTKTVSIRTDTTGVRLCSDGYDTTVEVTLDCEYDGAVACVVDYKALRDAAKTMPKSSSVIVQQDRDHLRLTAVSGMRDPRPGDGTVAAIMLVPGEPRELPALRDAGQIVWAVGSELAAAVNTVAHAASTEDWRPLLNGVLLESGPHTTAGQPVDTQLGPFPGPSIAATDSFRLHAHPLPGAQGQFRVAVNARGLLAATKGLGDDEGVTVHATDRRVEVKRHGERWQIDVPSGQWPLWRSLIPDAQPIQVTVDRAALEAGTMIATRAQGSSEAVTHRVPASVKTLKAGEGLGRTFGIDPHYLHAAVRHLHGATVRLDYNGPLKPVKIASRDTDTLGLIMPVRLGGVPIAKNKVPVQVQITDTELVLSVDAYTPPPTPQETAAARKAQAKAEQAAKDLADVPGVAKRTRRR